MNGKTYALTISITAGVLLIITSIIYFINNLVGGWYDIRDCLLLACLIMLFVGYPSLFGAVRRTVKK